MIKNEIFKEFRIVYVLPLNHLIQDLDRALKSLGFSAKVDKINNNTIIVGDKESHNVKILIKSHKVILDHLKVLGEVFEHRVEITASMDYELFKKLKRMLDISSLRGFD